jgi:DNA-binding NarL/FixJ family response regulator
LILAEERLVGRGLASLLQPRFETHTIESFQRANRMLGSDRVEVALWVGEHLDEATVGELADLKRAHPQLRLCLLARAANPDALRPLLTADACGIAVLLRSDDLDESHVLTSLVAVLAGRATLERSVLGRLLEQDGDKDDALARLNDSERQILELVAQGLRNREIARRVWRSEKAVEKQVSHVFEKLGLGRRTMPYLDRRVTAARIFFKCRPQSVEAAASAEQLVAELMSDYGQRSQAAGDRSPGSSGGASTVGGYTDRGGLSEDPAGRRPAAPGRRGIGMVPARDEVSSDSQRSTGASRGGSAAVAT